MTTYVDSISSTEAENLDETRLALLQEEQKLHEATIRKSRVRIAEIRQILAGDKDNPGLTAVVASERRHREWKAGEPERAAVRATPEWQAWRANFMEDERQRVETLMVWWEEEKFRRAQK